MIITVRIDKLGKMTRLFLIIALVLVINRCHSLKLNEDEIDLFNSVGQQQINSGVKFPIDFKSYLPLDSAETKSTSSYSGVKWSDAPLNSDFLDQNFELKARKFDLDSSSATNINVLFGTQSNLWISGSVLKKIDLENDLLVDHFKPGSKLFINKFSPNIVIISEPIRKSINLSKNNGQSFSLKSTPFRPDILYFTPDEAIVLGAEAIDQHANDLWVSLNFGEKWIHLGKCDKSTPEWEKSKEISSIYYINENQQLVKLNLKDLTSDQDVSSRAQVVKNDVREFELVDNKFLFVTSLNNDMVLQILNLKNPAEFVTATFNFDKTPERIMDYNVVWADDYEILVAVYYDLNDKIRSDLFRTTDMKKFSFDLTLKNLAYNDKKFDLEVKILNKRGGVVLANVHSDENDYRMVKTMCRLTPDSNEWKEIKTTPELKQSHLDLNSAKFMFSHEYENSLIDDPKSPDFAISTVLGKNGEKLGTYESQSDASEWSELNKGAHVSSYTNFGHILLSADQSRPVDELIFTLNKGVDWHRMKFADEAVLVNELLTVDPAKQDRLPRFVVIATSAKTGARLVFKIDAVRPQQNKSLPPDVSTEDKDDNDDDGDDECKQKCYNKLAPNQLICMRPEMICNGKAECMNDVDEFKCNSNVVENKPPSDDDDDDDDDEDDDIPSPLNRLSSVETSSSYEVKVRQAGFSKSAFTITYSLVRHGPSKVIYRPQVAVYRLRDERANSGDAVAVDDATLQTKAKLVNVFKYGLLENTFERTIELEGLDLPGYIYVCVFLVDLDFKTYKLNDRLVFTHTGFITNLKSSSSYEYYFKLAEIAGVALFATICFVLFAFLLCRCCQRRRQIIDMKYQHIEKTKNRIFSRSTVAGCDNQPLTGFIEDGIYNPPSV